MKRHETFDTRSDNLRRHDLEVDCIDSHWTPDISSTATPGEASLFSALKRAIAENPSYGWRRLKAELQAVDGIIVNHKRLKRLLKAPDLAIERQIAKKRRSGPAELVGRHRVLLDRVKGLNFGPLQAFATDFTCLAFGTDQRVWLMAHVDLHSKLLAGWALGTSRNTGVALKALDGLIKTLNNFGKETAEVIVHHDRDGVYTGYAWLRAVMHNHGMVVSYAARGARDNPWVESLWSRVKLECGPAIANATSLEQLETVIGDFFTYYNARRRHSAIGNQSPFEYLANLGLHVS